MGGRCAGGRCRFRAPARRWGGRRGRGHAQPVLQVVRCAVLRWCEVHRGLARAWPGKKRPSSVFFLEPGYRVQGGLVRPAFGLFTQPNRPIVATSNPVYIHPLSCLQIVKWKYWTFFLITVVKAKGYGCQNRACLLVWCGSL